MKVSTAINSRVAERAMLSHPFYQAWTEGRLPLDTLRDYARQYFHHVEAFPRAVSAVHSACDDREGRRDPQLSGRKTRQSSVQWLAPSISAASRRARGRLSKNCL